MTTDTELQVRQMVPYFDWLMSRIYYADEKFEDSYLLFTQLYEMTFYWTVPNDANRAADGTTLRGMYLEDFSIISDPSSVHFDRECSVFEALIGLGLRMAFQLGATDGAGPYVIEMLTNMGIWPCTNNELVHGRSFAVAEAVDRWLSRNFDKNGTHSPFPVTNLKEAHQNEVEIWYQMMSYICEISGLKRGF